MHTSFIYSDIANKSPNENLGLLGWFDPKESFEVIDASVNYVKFLGRPAEINKYTLIAYFPGCFAEFHEGHLDVVRQAIRQCQQITNNYLVVIAPANSDYTVEKYGKDSIFATNKYRYDRICKMLSGIDGRVAIDLNTMLNYKVDYNFTDLVCDFVRRHHLNYDDLYHVPRIVCGKDRDYFGNLTKATNKLGVIYVEDSTGASSSAYIKSLDNSKLTKKNLLLRCDNAEQHKLFVKYFGEQYNHVQLQLLSDEIAMAKTMNYIHNFDATICKDYADFLPYLKVHRRFENPLSSGDGHTIYNDLKGLKVLDSDIFSGGTKNMLASQGGMLYAVHDFSGCLETHELLDIADFYDDKYCYPYVDISSRCSMRAFDLEAHNNFNAFKNELKKIARS